MAEDTRTRILEAARDLVATRGFHGTSMSRIARRVGISTATIYHHFRSKGDLYHELYSRLKGSAMQAAMGGFDANAPLRDQVRRTNQQYVMHLLGHPQDASYIAQYERSTYSRRAPRIETREMLTGLTEEGIRQGIYRHPLPLLRAFSTGVAGLIAEMHAIGELDINEDIMQQTLEMAWNAMTK